MSKKKATMTLKDFHGGSIPSDLPLPSAPGVIVRPSDRGGYDRQASWGNSMGRSDHRLRPGSAGSARNFDDKTPFLSHTVQIGRNFDEDERKPLDGASAPRRTVSDESINALPNHSESKVEFSVVGKVSSRPVSAPVSQFSSHSVNTSHVAKSSEVSNIGLSPQTGSRSGVVVSSHCVGVNNGQVVSGSYQNPWGLRKEAAAGKQPASVAWSAPDAATKLANASALDKVSSGRWHSKQQFQSQPDVEVIKHQETERDSYRHNDLYDKNTYSNSAGVSGGVEYQDATLPWQAETTLSNDDGIHGGGKDVLAYARAGSPVYLEVNERKPSVYMNGLQSPHTAAKSGSPELQSPIPSEMSQRPKLNLLPRSKPLDNLEPHDHRKVLQLPSDPHYVETTSELHGTSHPNRTDLAGSEGGRVVERPKLNLKPRSQPPEQLESNNESKRNTLFGGARPRELVLKERGFDDVAVKNSDLRHTPNRVKQESSKSEAVPVQAARYSEKTENSTSDHRKNSDRRDHRVDSERTDTQTRNWRNENWRSKETEKHLFQQQQQLQERAPSPETWRKPVEQPKPTSDAPGLRYGKAASAVELATAFSRSVSDPAIGDHASTQRGLQSRAQIPFSRLMGPAPRPQINGY